MAKKKTTPEIDVVELDYNLGSRQLLVKSGEAWYFPYFNTKEIRTARP
jgi:hypothetical protein